jgi:hypothetical protein
MQRTDRRQARREGRAILTLVESEYLLGVSDQTKLGALRSDGKTKTYFSHSTYESSIL